MPAVLVNGLEQSVNIAKALGDETRLRIMALLEHQELCACQIIEGFALANSTISRHLALLKQAGLLRSRKVGRWVYYAWSSAEGQTVPEIVQLSHTWISHIISHDVRFQEDREHMADILRLDPEELCRRQNEKNCC